MLHEKTILRGGRRSRSVAPGRLDSGPAILKQVPHDAICESRRLTSGRVEPSAGIIAPPAVSFVREVETK
jgi:hypothetical protein